MKIEGESIIFFARSSFLRVYKSKLKSIQLKRKSKGIKMNDDLISKRGRCVAMRMILPADINGNGTVFGGAILSEYDLAGATAVRAILGLAQITTRHLEIDFTKALYPGDIFTIYGKVTHIGNTSVTISLEGWRTSSENEEECFSNVKVVFVNINERGLPMPIPQWARDRALQEMEKYQEKSKLY